MNIADQAFENLLECDDVTSMVACLAFYDVSLDTVVTLLSEMVADLEHLAECEQKFWQQVAEAVLIMWDIRYPLSVAA